MTDTPNATARESADHIAEIMLDNYRESARGSDPGSVAATEQDLARAREHLREHHGLDLADDHTRAIILATLHALACETDALENVTNRPRALLQANGPAVAYRGAAALIATSNIGAPAALAHTPVRRGGE